MYKYISGDEVLANYKMEDLIKCIEQEYKLLGGGKIQVSARTFMDTKDGGDYLFGAATNLERETFLVRGSAYMPWFNNTKTPNVTGYYMLTSFRTGDLNALVEGKDIVILRTGAKSAIAVRYLARENSNVLGLIGLGNQMKTQTEAICKIRDIKRVVAWTRNPDAHLETINYIKSKTGIEVELKSSVNEIMQESDIIVVATHSKEPLINYKDAKAGQLILSISHSIEVSDDFVFNSDKVYVDYIETAKNEFGPFKSAMQKGFEINKLNGDLSALATGKIQGREDENEIIFFQSLGVMLEDMATVEYLYDKLS